MKDDKLNLDKMFETIKPVKDRLEEEKDHKFKLLQDQKLNNGRFLFLSQLIKPKPKN